MLYTNGIAWVNGSHVPRSSSAIFSGDLLQSQIDAVANQRAGLNHHGASDSLVQFEGSSVKIEHGGVTVATSRGVATTAGDVKVAPAAFSWTEFNVSDGDGTVRIAARKGDLTITDGKEVLTLAPDQETTRDDSSGDIDQNGKKKKHQNGQGGAIPGAGGALNSPIAIGIGAGAIIGITTWVLV